MVVSFLNCDMNPFYFEIEIVRIYIELKIINI